MIDLNDIVPHFDDVQKVKVVNNGTAENPTTVNVQNLPLTGNGNAVVTSLTGNAASVGLLWRPAQGNYNVHVDALYIVDTQSGGVIVVPLGSNYYNMTTAQITTMENGFHSLNLLYPATSRAYVVYSKYGSTLSTEQVVYSLQ